MINLYQMDVLKALKQMPDESVDMQITSPPYWGLRDYGEGTESIWDGDENCEHVWDTIKHAAKGGKTKLDNMPKVGSNLKEQTDGISVRFGYETNVCNKCGAWKGQLGLEPDFNLFIKHLADIFDEVKRVLKKDGTCWINIGDTYGGSGQGSQTGYGDYKRQKVIGSMDKSITINAGVPAKCLCAIPERFMIEMINRGWILRNKIIWHKPNHMPTSVKDRFATSWEYLFLFSKSKKYYFDLDAVREPHKAESFKRALRGTSGKDKSSLDPMYGYKRQFSPHGILDERALNPKGKNPGDVIEDRTQYLISKLYEIKKDIRDEKISYKGKSKDLSQYNNALANAKAFRDGLKILQKKENLSDDELKWLKDYVQNHFGHPKGKNPGDVLITKFSEGDGYRQGMNRDEDIVIEYRPNLPTQEQLTEFLLEWTNGFEKDLDKEFGEYKWKHWIRKDDSGFSYPSRKDWTTLKTMLDFPDTYDKQMLFTEKKSNAIINNPQGRNPSDFWDITTRGYPEAHFAVFPEALIERPIKTTRKNAVIMDIFAGSGTTLAVARRLNRDSIGIEIKKEYCDLIFKRLYKGNIPLDETEFKLKNE